LRLISSGALLKVRRGILLIVGEGPETATPTEVK
jgi:hypothetical protein